MKDWLKDKIPLPVRLGLKRQLTWISRRRKTEFNNRTIEAPTFSQNGLVDFEEVESFLSTVTSLPRVSGESIKTSIIIPVFNKAEFTFQCLRSLVTEINFVETEVIVINNASVDQTSQLLSAFERFIRVIENNENRGFGEASNQGAAQARGKFLVFLNNDTIVLPGWLDALVETAERDPRIGAVGPLFLHPDGKIQEAGSIVWNDGTALRYGWGASAEDRRFTFSRDVDYCSGASLLIRKELFDRLDGFDSRFAPAYYEDVDICFGVRSLGYRVIFQPAARIIHYEGATAGRDVDSGVKRFQVVNRAKFYEKWKEELKREHFADEKQNIQKAARRIPDASVIVFDEVLPAPDRDAGSARMFLILQILARQYHTVFVYRTKLSDPRYEQSLWQEGIETVNLIYYANVLKQQNFKTAIVSRPVLMHTLLLSLRKLAPRTKIIFDSVDAHYRRLEREYELSGDDNVKRKADYFREIELEVVRGCDMVWFTSIEDEMSLTNEASGRPVAIIPTIHPLHDRGKAFAERRNLLFIGNFKHPPNCDAVEFFIEKVLPLIRKRLPEIKLDVVGSNAPESFQAYGSEGVCFHGYVPDIEPLFHSTRVFVAPLRFGAGVKGKIGDALSYGVPVVTTDVGAEGMQFEHGNQVLLANTPEDFARSVIEIYTNPELWQRLSDAGYEHVARYFSPEILERVILNSLRD
jgi:GT2 family glycosyltransferase/glycosyltransferase involved in cell wall biosynthesis